MRRSDPIGELARALSQAQGQMSGARKDGLNPHFRSQYSTLASVWEAARPPLAAHGLAVVQSPTLVHAGEDLWLVEVKTLLLHASGQWLEDSLAVPVVALNAQAVGSAVSYAKRYQLQSILGIAPTDADDDDGNAAVGSQPDDDASAAPRAKSKKTPATPVVTETTIGRVASIARRVLKSGKEKYIVKLQHDGREYETWSLTTATAAKEAQGAERDVELVFKPGRFALEILALRNPHEPEPPL